MVASLALQPFKALGFHHDRCPFCSVKTSCSPSLYTHVPQVPFNTHINLGLRFHLPLPGWPSSNFFTVFLPSILTTCPRHSNLFLFSSNHFHMFAQMLFSRFPFPKSLRLFPFHSLWSMIQHHRSQLVLFLSNLNEYVIYIDYTAEGKKLVSIISETFIELIWTQTWCRYLSEKLLAQISFSLYFMESTTYELFQFKSYKG